jgi:hypothetical protein
MRTYQLPAITALNSYDILYAAHKSDSSVGSGRRRRYIEIDMDFDSPQRCET